MRGWMLAAIAAGGIALEGCGASVNLPQSGRLTGGLTAPGDPTPTSKKATFNPFEDRSETSIGRREIIANPTVAEVMQTAGLPERALGRPDAPVTIVKYASLTCPYCRKFHLETFPVLKREYIDTGKVRIVLREFPIGFQSGAATIALRCAPADKYFALYGKFMSQQSRWVSQDVRREPIFQIARQVGMTRAAFDACFEDKALVANLQWVKDRGRTLGVIGTPNFFVNGKLYKRVLTMHDIHKLVADALARPVANRR